VSGPNIPALHGPERDVRGPDEDVYLVLRVSETIAAGEAYSVHTLDLRMPVARHLAAVIGTLDHRTRR
jgi:hypothetical protein